MSDDARAPRESLPALTTLRFVAAMAVVLFHADYLDPVLPVMVRRVAHASYVAVTLFYVLSGFILTWNHGEAFAAGRLRASDFWLARFARVYPAYLVAAGLWWLVARSQEPPVHAMSLHTLVSLAGLQPWSPSTIPGTNIPGWSVGVEACFYLAFPLLASRLVGASSRLRAGTILVASYALSLLSWLAFRAHGNGDEAHLLTGPLFRLPEFVAGMCLGRLFVLERAKPAPPRDGTVMVLAGALASLTLALCESRLPFGLFHNGLCVPAFGLVIYGLARGGLVTRVMSHPVGVALGERGYSLYIFQLPIVIILTRWLPTEAPGVHLSRVFLAHTVILVEASFLGYALVERPARSALRHAGPTTRRALAAGYLALLVIIGLALRAHLADPFIALTSDFQRGLGCTGNWSPDCALTRLHPPSVPGAPWTVALRVPAGHHAFKVALHGDWLESYGRDGLRDGPNLEIDLAAPSLVRFAWAPHTHRITADHDAVFTAPGTWQRHVGCAADWQPECLRHALDDADGDGVYTATVNLPTGHYQTKIAVNGSWRENYGADGVRNGDNVTFDVGHDGRVEFRYDPRTHRLTVAPR